MIYAEEMLVTSAVSQFCLTTQVGLVQKDLTGWLTRKEKLWQRTELFYVDGISVKESAKKAEKLITMDFARDALSMRRIRTENLTEQMTRETKKRTLTENRRN